jgi:ATP-dependent DNA helicase RecG
METPTFSVLWDSLCQGDESVLIEAKRGRQVGRSALRTVSAFANEPGCGGGFLLFGVARSRDSLFPDYSVVGVPDADRLQADLACQCRELFNVPVRPAISVEQHGGCTVVSAFIPEARPHDKPVYITSDGLPRGAFRRIGSTNQQCTDDDIALFYNLRGHRTFDETPVEDTTLDDFDSSAVARYREVRAEQNPEAAELEYGDQDLLYALAATSRVGGATCATVAGLVLFGTQATVRRHFPMARVDYIRVEGREWVPDPENRYEALEFRGPLMTLLPRIVSQVLDDIPKAFSLRQDQLHRQDVPLVPRTVIREAVVNAVMHRNYRHRQAIQIIRYANRIELRNPGHSLVPEDRLGEPGSLCRNEKIAAVLHDVGFAETKGTGIRAMREAMERANLTLPVFESDRDRDAFTATLLVHHFLGRVDLQWLENFRQCELTDDEARALIMVREMGLTSNAIYRGLNHMDTLTASTHLRRLRDLGLLQQMGAGASTYYIPGERLRATPAPGREPIRQRTGSQDRPLSAELRALPAEFPPLPADLTEAVQSLGKRAPPEQVQQVIAQLCRWRALRAAELAIILGRDPRYLRQRYLGPMLKRGRLKRTFPDQPQHPAQAYEAE